MKIKKVSYFEQELESSCVDVVVTLEDEFSYFVEVTEFFYRLMEKYGSQFVPPEYPYIIVSKLTDEIIKSAIQSFVDTEDDSYWLKLYHITPSFLLV